MEPALISQVGGSVLPATRSQVKRWSRAIRYDLARWVKDEAHPAVKEYLLRAGFKAQTRVENEKLFICYETLFERYGLVRPEIMVEFGARSTGEPHTVTTIRCDAASYLVPDNKL